MTDLLPWLIPLVVVVVLGAVLGLVVPRVRRGKQLPPVVVERPEAVAPDLTVAPPEVSAAEAEAPVLEHPAPVAGRLVRLRDRVPAEDQPAETD